MGHQGLGMAMTVHTIHPRDSYHQQGQVWVCSLRHNRRVCNSQPPRQFHLHVRGQSATANIPAQPEQPASSAFRMSSPFWSSCQPADRAKVTSCFSRLFAIGFGVPLSNKIFIWLRAKSSFGYAADFLRLSPAKCSTARTSSGVTSKTSVIS